MIIQLITNGLAMGSIYTLVGIATVLLYNAAGQVNFAQGEFVMLGAFVAYTLLKFAGLPYPVAILLMVLFMGGFGIAFDRLIYRPVSSRAGGLTFIVITAVASILLKNLALNIWGAVPRPFPSLFGDELIWIGELSVVPQYLYIVVVSALLMGALYYLLFRTILGKKMRAAAQDRVAARLMGISPNYVIVWNFILCSIFMGIAGALLAPIFFVEIDIGGLPALYAFSASIIGGFGSIPGVIVGGLSLGLVEIFTAAYISSEYKVAISFLILVAFLLVRPTGLFGEKISQKL
jgi:branched-chain amino acid transport system permease protein